MNIPPLIHKLNILLGTNPPRPMIVYCYQGPHSITVTNWCQGKDVLKVYTHVQEDGTLSGNACVTLGQELGPRSVVSNMV